MIHPDVARGLAAESEARARDVLAERKRLNDRIEELERFVSAIANGPEWSVSDGVRSRAKALLG